MSTERTDAGHDTSSAVEQSMRASVAVLAPAGRDGAVTARVLAQAGFSPNICDNMAALCATIADAAPSGDATGTAIGVWLIAEEALTGTARAMLLAALAAQPTWSDVPLLVLTGEGELSRTLSPALHALIAHANVTLLERPVRVATLVTALRSAVRARQRQFDMRDHLAERAAAAAALDAARAQADAARAIAETERARAEAERTRAEDANQAKAAFLAVMSHELRTPLNAIGGYAQLIELGIHGAVTDAQRTALGRVQRAQTHLLGLINDVLNFAKLESGRVDYVLGVVDVRGVVAEVIPLIEPQLAARGLTLSVHVPDHASYVWADREKLGQVLVNLLSNAVKFTDARHPITGVPGCITVDLGTRAGTRGAGASVEASEAVVEHVYLRVRDTGRGIPREKQEAIFEPFVQVRMGYAQATEGTGLGLAISRDLARGMGGDLRVRSVEDEGATFTVTLRGATPESPRRSGSERG